MQIWVSYKKRQQYKDTTGDPWDGRTLEWATASPPALYNFAIIRGAACRDPVWEQKQHGKKAPPPHYEEIHMPKNTPLGLYIGLFSAMICFGIIWYMWWLAWIGLFGTVVCLIARVFDPHPEYTISASEVKAIEKRGASHD